MSIQINTSEITTDNLIKLDAGCGEFYIGNAGGKPDMPFIYFYADHLDQFFFPGDWEKISDTENLMKIGRLSSQRLRLQKPHINRDNVTNIMHNLAYVFRTRSFAFVKSPALSNEVADKTQFDWDH